MCDKEKMEDLGTLPNGTHLSRKRNTAGGWTYYSDECGCGHMVWDTCLTNESTLLAAMLCEQHRKYMESMTNKGWKPQEDMDNDPMAGTGESFLDPINSGAVNKSEEGKSDKDEKWCSHVVIGDVIFLDEKECGLLMFGDLSIAGVGEYVVENTRESGGWAVEARKLDAMGKYCADNPTVRFQQGIGYTHSLPTVRVVRRISRTFV